MFSQFTSLKALSAAGLVALSAYSASAAPVVLTFEGLGNDAPIGNYYNGGAGGNYGISFGPSSIALTSGNFGNNPSGDTIAYFVSGAGDVMDVAAGFNTGFSFYYAAFDAGSVAVYSGLDGTGTLLADISLAATPNPAYVWENTGVTFNGTAESVIFGGSADEIGFDNITLGSSTATPGNGAPASVPDMGSTASFLGLALLGLGAIRRKLS